VRDASHPGLKKKQKKRPERGRGVGKEGDGRKKKKKTGEKNKQKRKETEVNTLSKNSIGGRQAPNRKKQEVGNRTNAKLPGSFKVKKRSPLSNAGQERLWG